MGGVAEQRGACRSIHAAALLQALALALELHVPDGLTLLQRAPKQVRKHSTSRAGQGQDGPTCHFTGINTARR